jgi:hypothetical protein
MTASPLRRTFLLLALVTHLRVIRAGEPEAATLPQAIGTLELAKSKAEDAVHIVKLYATNIPPATQIGAMQRYSTARAAFNAFIESLLAERDPEGAASGTIYWTELDQAKQAAETFVNFVQDKVVAQQSKGGKAAIGDLLDGIGKLFEGLGKLSESAVIVHQEYTRESDARRKEIRQQLEGLKWQQFLNIP